MQGRQPAEVPKKFSTSSARPAKSIAAFDFMKKRLKDLFRLDTSYCDVVELSLLTLAGIEEKPDKCRFDGGMHPFLTKDKLDPNHSTLNSIFFKLPLSNGSMEQLKKFLNAKDIKFYDYTPALSKEDKDANIRVFCIGYESYEDVICPEIIKYLRNNRAIVEEHLAAMNKRTGTVRGYEYTRCFKGSIYEQEIFIPSEKICFSRFKAYKRDKPDNKDEEYFESHTVLKRVSVPVGIVDKLKDELKGNDVVELEASETIRFFGYGGILMMDFVADENAFMDNYSEFGVFILPNYIMKYFENENKLDTQSRTATRILELINTLDPIEKQSLATCLEERIKNLNEKNRNNTYAFPITFPTGAAAVAASAVTGLILESIPASVFAGGIVLFGKKKYDEYYNNQREEYRNQIFEALGMQPRSSATQYHSPRFSRG